MKNLGTKCSYFVFFTSSIISYVLHDAANREGESSIITGIIFGFIVLGIFFQIPRLFLRDIEGWSEIKINITALIICSAAIWLEFLFFKNTSIDKIINISYNAGGYITLGLPTFFAWIIKKIATNDRAKS